MKVESESEVTQLCLTLRDPMDCSLPGSSIHGIFQAALLEWGAIVFSKEISSLSHSVVFLYFLALITEEGFLISPCYSLELCIQLYMYTYISFEIIFHYRLLEGIDSSSLFYTVNLHCFLHIYFLLEI